MKKLFWLFGIVSLLWIGIIFMFSAKKGNDSAGESMTFLRWCCENTIDDFSTWSYEKQQAFIRRWNYPVRKLAHVTEYFMLGVLLAGTWNLYRSRAGYGCSPGLLERCLQHLMKSINGMYREEKQR